MMKPRPSSDIRVWLLRQERPSAGFIAEDINSVPPADIRSPEVLKLYLKVFNANPVLTDTNGVPTPLLHHLAGLMGAKIVQGADLPENWKRYFSKPRNANPKQNLHGDNWCLNPDAWYWYGVSDQLKSMISSTWDECKHLFGPLHWRRVAVGKSNGKLRYQVCYLAEVKKHWRVSDRVYRGLHFWRHDQFKTWLDSHALLERLIQNADASKKHTRDAHPAA